MTVRTYRDAVRTRLRAAVGDLPLGCSARDLQAAFDGIAADDLPTTTVARLRTTIGAAMTWAVDQGWIESSPVRRLRTPPAKPGVRSLAPRAPAPRVDIPTADEVSRFLAYSHAHDDPYYVMWLVGFAGGLRAGELCALREDEIDTNAAGLPIRLRVEAKVVAPRGGGPPIVESPKRGRPRNLALPETIMRALAEQAAYARTLGNPDWEVEWVGYLFRRGELGRPPTPEDVAHLFRRRCALAGIEPYSPHAMRHWCASALIDGGASSIEVAHWLGHMTTVMVERTYGHRLAARRSYRSEAEAISEALRLPNP
jgi:integrase